MFKMSLVSAVKESNFLSRGKNSVVYRQSFWAKDASSEELSLSSYLHKALPRAHSISLVSSSVSKQKPLYSPTLVTTE